MRKENKSQEGISKKSAFTLIEILTAIAVLAIGLLAVVALSSKSYAAISLQKNRLIAMNLAKEEMEIIRNVRNENWLYESASYCSKTDGSYTTCDGVNPIPKGRKAEDGSDCDWRCGSKDVSPLTDLADFYRLESTTAQGIKDLDYFGNVKKGIHANDCQSQGVPLYQETSGPYEHFYTNNSENTQPTPFARLVTVDRIKDTDGDGNLSNDIQVIVTVCWEERGRPAQVSTEEHFFNWME